VLKPSPPMPRYLHSLRHLIYCAGPSRGYALINSLRLSHKYSAIPVEKEPKMSAITATFNFFGG